MGKSILNKFVFCRSFYTIIYFLICVRVAYFLCKMDFPSLINEFYAKKAWRVQSNGKNLILFVPLCKVIYGLCYIQYAKCG